jgi:hypothetical protein
VKGMIGFIPVSATGFSRWSSTTEAPASSQGEILRHVGQGLKLKFIKLTTGQQWSNEAMLFKQ